MTHTVYLSLGSNLGNRKQLLLDAIEKINKKVGNVVRQSSFYETKPWGFESENLFLNAAVKVTTKFSPTELLEVTQQIEREMGRKKKTTYNFRQQTPNYSDRPIDIDILLYDDLHVDLPELKIPHPLMQERDFVLVPLREIIDADRELLQSHDSE
ncbi:MAG: 2-amino-4-hydroxy-6-hydroxymethyldihydropteridine diphosphokinase [Prevotella sp.]|nr:2-amino-4-hydroxy-6-hydroxymethyldihydropteridine diphosphokinase [Prevotella sp.]